MKIALCYNEVLPALRYGGVERVVMGLAKSLCQLGHEVFLLGKAGSELPDFEHGFYPEHWRGGDYGPLVPADVDFIHSHQGDKAPSTKPYLTTVHGNASPGEVFLPNTNFVSRSHARNHNAKYFVLQGIDVERYPFQECKDDYVVFLAKAKWRVKNLRTAIAFANDNKVKLKVIGGTGSNSRYVEYLGLLGDHEGRLEILGKARALLYPTNWDEPCALAPLEAMACGTPVIGTVNGAMPEEVPPNLGFLCRTYHDFSEAFAKLDQISPLVLRQHVAQNFSSLRQAQDYLKLYNKILSVGELDQTPRHALHPSTISYLYKPTLLNKTLFSLRGKI